MGFSSIGLLQIPGNIISVKMKPSFSIRPEEEKENYTVTRKIKKDFLLERFYNSILVSVSMCFNFTV